MHLPTKDSKQAKRLCESAERVAGSTLELDPRDVITFGGTYLYRYAHTEKNIPTDWVVGRVADLRAALQQGKIYELIYQQLTETEQIAILSQGQEEIDKYDRRDHGRTTD